MSDSDFSRAGRLEVRLAATAAEIEAAQTLRYQVFFEEGGARPDPASRLARRDLCRFDAVCDHLIALEADVSGAAPRVVGAYRLLRQEVAERSFGFYSAAEFDVAALVARHPGLRFMELGRSCVARGWRGKRAIESLWRGVWAYALSYGADVMIGCASFPGADANLHAPALTALTSARGLEPEWSVAPVGRAACWSSAAAVDARASLRRLPPLVKGYLRLGARFGREAVVDEAFGAVDVFVVLRVADIEARYLNHFAPPEATTLAA